MGPRRYELSDFEWSVIQPLLPNKPRRVPRAYDRKVLNGIYWRLRTGSPWADIPELWTVYDLRQLVPPLGKVRREEAIQAYIEQTNAEPKAFRWTKTADDILASIGRFCQRTSNSDH